MKPLFLLTSIFLFLLSSCFEKENSSSDFRNQQKPNEYVIQFTDITNTAGLGEFQHETGAFGEKWMPETFGSGGGFIDYNGDGWLDILLVGGGSWPAFTGTEIQCLWLYRNNKDGSFTYVTQEAGLDGISTYGFGISAADYDNDGDDDFIFTTVFQNIFFRNDNGVFTDISSDAGIADVSEWSTSALFFDADRDGWLDLYIGNYVDWTPEKDIFCSIDGITKEYCTPLLYDGIPGRFYHNNKDGTFTDQTLERGFLPAPGKTLGTASMDFNRDGWTDLVVASDTERDLLYENNGDGTFVEKGMLAGIAFDEVGRASAGMGIDTGVLDSTGQESILVGNFSREMVGVFRYTGEDFFSPRSSISRIGRPSLLKLTFGLFLFDVELDGDLDVLSANGHIQPGIQDGSSYRQPAQIYRNRGNGIFDDVSAEIGQPLLDSLVARSASYGDIDNDGDLDILLTENGGPARLWRNDSKSGNYLRIKTTGIQSNRDGIDASIRLFTNKHILYNRVKTGSSYLANSEKTVTFGLGEYSSVDSLKIFWPSGNTQDFYSLPANKTILITENSEQLSMLE
ncbi:MAG: CRTAC1 family protein [Candidatus Marinimicrobia bacterium]|nr:CRTAC1 family protein [Candidatus Neomarinimicrobiota bacterium]